jgi:thioredoxin reductase (NADPH)
LTAAIYTACENIETVLIEKGSVGGIMAGVGRIDNYPGFLNEVSGEFLAEVLRSQAEKFGARVRVGEVQALRRVGDSIVITAGNSTLKTRAVLVATGSSYERLWIPGEEEFYGKGIHYSSALDGVMYTDRRLAVVGGGDSAVQEAMFLTKFASHVDLVVRSHVKAANVLKQELSGYIDNGKITLHEGWVSDRIVSTDNRVTSLAVRKTDSDDTDQLVVDGVFIFAGVIPNTGFLAGSGVELDQNDNVEKRTVNLKEDDIIEIALMYIGLNSNVHSYNVIVYAIKANLFEDNFFELLNPIKFSLLDLLIKKSISFSVLENFSTKF